MCSRPLTVTRTKAVRRTSRIQSRVKDDDHFCLSSERRRSRRVMNNTPLMIKAHIAAARTRSTVTRPKRLPGADAGGGEEDLSVDSAAGEAGGCEVQT